MNEEIKSLIKKRGIVKCKTTLFNKYLNSLTETLTKETVDSKIEMLELEGRLSRFSNLFQEFNDIQVVLEELDENLDEQLQEREFFEDQFYKLQAKAENILQTNTKPERVSERADSSSNHPNKYFEPGDTPNSAYDGLKLPEIKISKFDGTQNKWLEFRDTFESLIHENPKLKDMQRFHHLRAALEGTARTAISHLEFSAKNYNAAWQALLARFNNKRRLINNHLKTVYSFTEIKQESSNDLQNMIDIVIKNLQSLKALGVNIDNWDLLVIFYMSQRLDKKTKQLWRDCKLQSDVPTLDEFLKFLQDRVTILMSDESDKVENQTEFKRKLSWQKPNKPHSLLISTKLICSVCAENHAIYNCPRFLQLPPNSRLATVKSLKLCTNCLRNNHYTKHCQVTFGCRKCKGRHNTLLHFESDSNSSPAIQEINNTTIKDGEKTASTSINLSCRNLPIQNKNILLSTAIVQVTDKYGKPQKCRILLDSGSQTSLITYSCCERLGLEKSNINFCVAGLGQALAHIKHSCNVTIHSYHNAYTVAISCLVIQKITNSIPNTVISAFINIPANIKLADPSYNQPGPIDMLVGAEFFYNLLCIGQISLGKNQPVLQKTCLGWIISGPVTSCLSESQSSCFLSSNLDIQNQLAKFWELEECNHQLPYLSKEEQECEENFKNTTTRSDSGQFIVCLPLKDSPNRLGDSLQTAIRQFYSLENRLQKNERLKTMYVEFMNEYQQLRHMEYLCDVSDLESHTKNQISYFFPHHGVLKESSITTKLRVVFNGSAPTNSGLSLNDLQMIGPKIQDDLLNILFRFRKHPIVICSDVEKMYRQVLIHPDYRPLQRILWRDESSKNLQVYTLNTVTYGTTAAPYLAIRCLKQLAFDFQEEFPQASEIISRDFYVDDLLSGANTVEEAIQLSKDISSILSSASFTLRKWLSNSKEVLQYYQINQSFELLPLGEKTSTKTLGLLWSSSDDTLMYNIGQVSLSRKITKRTILSDVSQIFDPLGLLGPCIILAKMILQQLWLHKLSWDETIPQILDTNWRRFRSNLSCLNELKITRRACLNSNSVEIHGFADASSQAYGGCIYIRSTDEHNKIYSRLLCSKSRVAPIKSITTPRLELCAAVVLVNLFTRVKSSLNINISKSFYWTDSSIVLSWLKTQPCYLQSFVANRVAQIQSSSRIDDWHHISTEENPADVLSRGTDPSLLKDIRIWWEGPSWLSLDRDSWPNSKAVLQGELPEIKKQTSVFITTDVVSFPFQRFSNFSRLVRSMAYILRFYHNVKTPKSKKVGSLSTEELSESRTLVIKIAQSQLFAKEISMLTQGQGSCLKGSILKLNPFIDDKGVLRVGGRLHLSDFSYDKKHPILLSSKHHLTELIFVHEHLRLFHAGPQLLLSSIRDFYWSLGGRNLAKKIVHKCIKCYRFNHNQQNPIMGILPKSRVQPTPPFHVCGVDYAGPFTIKDKFGRGARPLKCYLCVFICFSTRAIHLEPVTQLSTEAFLSVFKRFVSRRGKPKVIFSDNGRNFVGAKSKMQELGEFLINNSGTISESISEEGVTWNFIPVHSPHFGGLWEAGVKSSKFHLKRVLSNTLLNFEEFLTVITQIEAIINSRPLTPLSADPSDLHALTPSHFLIGRRITALLDQDFQDIPVNRLTKYQQIQQMQQHFWSRWAKEYVSELQTRQKWKTNQFNLKIDDMVVIKIDNQSPLHWPLGRVVQLHPGPDGIIRVATIRTSSGLVKRSFSKICILPID